MITVNFYTTLRLMLSTKEITIDCKDQMTILEVLKHAEEIIEKSLSKNFIWKLLDEDGNIKLGTIIMINGKNILDMDGLECMVSPGDTIALFPPGGGG
ncbi:MoaD/ThiS family protein [bacterium]|nr:MoaD/ThiS family protein [bacterium]